MPLKVRLKIVLWVLASVALLIALAVWLSPFLALCLALVGILYGDMINPAWNFFGKALTHVKACGPRAIALTFDDGPSPWTLPILDTLRAQQVKATFFLLGKNIERHPEIARRIVAEGHAVGMHAYSHTKLHWKGLNFIRQDLDACEAAFRAAGMAVPTLIRFPHGVKNLFAVKEIQRRGLKLCGWGLGIWDSKKPGVDVLVERAKKLKAGEILLLHDGDGAKENPDRSQTASALGPIIEAYRQQGYTFVTLEEAADEGSSKVAASSSRLGSTRT
jgi:peptidoglycan/xylan/chitin deacetylase (PgdA/CDA1 family)